jgi:hypothetical protein
MGENKLIKVVGINVFFFLIWNSHRKKKFFLQSLKTKNINQEQGKK